VLFDHHKALPKSKLNSKYTSEKKSSLAEPAKLLNKEAFASKTAFDKSVQDSLHEPVTDKMNVTGKQTVTNKSVDHESLMIDS
jgi:hypothetical protein